VEKKKLYNISGVDSLEETLIGGNPSGLLNFNRTRYKWATSLYKTMRDCFWTPESVNTSAESKQYAKLSEKDKFAYDRVFARLSFLDSLVADSLADNLNGYITNKIVNACIIEQSAQEVLHSKSYAVLLADTVEDSDRVFNLYKEDLTLNAFNTAIAEMFDEINQGDEVTPEKIYYALVANQLLEGIFFQTGFATIYDLGNTMVASASMIAEIHKDENNHIALFENMIREFQKENRDLPWFLIRAKTNAMFDKAYQLESSWMHYILGHAYSRDVTDATVAYFIKKRQTKINMYDHETDQYGFGYETPLVKKLNNRESGNDTRTNFFEGKVTTYSKQELKWEEVDEVGFDVKIPDVKDHWRYKQQDYRDAVATKHKDKMHIEDRSGECVGCQ
jgi:ribonucleoside-diphosphate reductase beta chain